MQHGAAPARGQPGQFRQLVGDTAGQQQLARGQHLAIGGTYFHALCAGVGLHSLGMHPAHAGVIQQLLARGLQQLGAADAIQPWHPVRMAGEAVARRAGVDDGDRPPGAGQDQAGGNAGVAAADDEHIRIHEDLPGNGDGRDGGRSRRRAGPAWSPAGAPPATAVPRVPPPAARC